MTTIIRILILCLTCHYSFAQPLVHVGIPTATIEYRQAARIQDKDQWCWAASIEMVFKYYGVNVDQSDVVRRTFGLDQQGQLINSAASTEQITSALNSWGIDRNGRRFTVSALYYPGLPQPAGLINELSLQHPIIVAYQSGPTTGHAVVLTACSYVPTVQGPFIQSLIVRDPWPDQQTIQTFGRREYVGTQLISNIRGFWIIRVTLL